MILHYKKSAEVFEEALPIGNGATGAMVYGGVKREKISLNHDTFWSGGPYEENDPNVYESFQNVRSLMDQGDVVSALGQINEKLINGTSDAYMAGANLYLDLNNLDNENITNYTRSLDLTTAVTNTKFSVGDTEVERDMFASYPDKSMTMRVKFSKPTSSTISLDSLHPHTFETLSDGNLQMMARAPYYSAPSYLKKKENPIRYNEEQENTTVKLYIRMNIETDGTVSDENGKRIVKNATIIYIKLKLATGFINFKTSPIQEIDSRISNELTFSNLSYDDVLKSHIEDYQSLFNRASLSLSDDDTFSDIPTDERVIRQEKTHDDPSLVTLLWQYGRYLSIACSREGTIAANLQGIWNEIERAPWSSNYTTNINAQMNYWHCETANLSECHMPLLELLRTLSITGQQTAKNYYNCKGWCLHHNTDIWGYSKPAGVGATHAFWPMGGGWLCLHAWEHYQYTLDKTFLEDFYPVISGAVEFLLDWWKMGEDGLYHSYPSTSPENTYLIDGQKVCISYDTAMDIAITQDLFDICIKMEELLGKNTHTQKLNEIKPLLAPYKIGTSGQLLEWDKEYEEAEPKHRHVSLLYGLYPSNTIKFSQTDLISACNKILDRRGNKTTGWGIAWRINVFARLRNSKIALETIQNLLTTVPHDAKFCDGGLYPNLFDAHPPFQIDGNFGYTAGVCEMLLQSQENIIDLLPACPVEWSGNFDGFKARGNHLISCHFKNGELVNSQIIFGNDGTHLVSYNGKTIEITAKSGEEKEVNKSMFL